MKSGPAVCVFVCEHSHTVTQGVNFRNAQRVLVLCECQTVHCFNSVASVCREGKAVSFDAL